MAKDIINPAVASLQKCPIPAPPMGKAHMRERRGLPATCSGGCEEERDGDGGGQRWRRCFHPCHPKGTGVGLVYSSKNSQMNHIYLTRRLCKISICAFKNKDTYVYLLLALLCSYYYLTTTTLLSYIYYSAMYLIRRPYLISMNCNFCRLNCEVFIYVHYST